MPELSESTTPSLEDLRADWVWAQDYFGATGTPAAQYIEEFHRAINKIRAEAVRDAASGLIDWDIMYGHESETSESKVSHANAAYLLRVADDFERGGH